MSGVLEGGDRKAYPHAPPLAAVNPFSKPVKKVVIVGGTHGNEYTVSLRNPLFSYRIDKQSSDFNSSIPMRQGSLVHQVHREATSNME